MTNSEEKQNEASKITINKNDMETVKMIEEIGKLIEVKIKKLKSLKALNRNILDNEFSEYCDSEIITLNELRKLNDNFKDKLLE